MRLMDADGLDGRIISDSHRDLSSADLWATSLQRSQHRRELAAISRKHAPRRKGASLALSAAVVAAPAAPAMGAAGAGSSQGRAAGATDAPSPLATPVLLAPGASGGMVV